MFVYPYVVPNMYEFISILECKKKQDILNNFGKHKVAGCHCFYSVFFPTMEVNGYQQLFGYQHSSKYHLLCSAEKMNSYRFEIA